MVDRFSDLDDMEIVATRTDRSARRTRAGVKLMTSSRERLMKRPKWKKQLSGYRAGKKRGL